MKKAVIVFTDEWLPYSSTVLNLLTCTREKGYETVIASVRSGEFQNFDCFENEVRTFQVSASLQRILGRLRLYRLYKFVCFILVHGKTIRKADLCFGVDSIGFLVAKVLQKNPYYVSLEVQRDVWFRCARLLGIRHVLIQTTERYDFLFNDAGRKPEYSTLPNSPILKAFHRSPVEASELIYFGLISASHGVESCIEALHYLPDSFRLTLRGPASPQYAETIQSRHRALFSSARLTLETGYLSAEDVVPFLSHFAVGFCFYDFNIIARNDFNYVSCPSGKLYSYLAAGVPVIGTNIIGLEVVQRMHCGILLNETTPDAVADAVLKITGDLPDLQRNCRAAAAAFDFRTHFNHFYENNLN